MEEKKKLNSVFEKCKKIAVEAGDLLQRNYNFDPLVKSNEGKDIKTEADTFSEDFIISNLTSFGFPILGEEYGVSNIISGVDVFDLFCKKNISSIKDEESEKIIFIIDPLDGTFNFSKGFQHSCVSIALWKEGNPVFGVIYDFNNQKLYSSYSGKGAHIDGDKVKPSTIDQLQNATLATGFPSHSKFDSDSLNSLIRNFQLYKKIRMIGSAALSLAYVSSGIFDAYSENGIKIWDVAAGLAILKEAGGSFCMSEINDNWQVDVKASNGNLIM